MAAIEWKGQRTIVIGAKVTPQTLDAIRAASNTLGIHQWFCFDSLPLDRRHNAKIDYPALTEMIKVHEAKTQKR